MPSGFRNLSSNEITVLKEWVKQGGTLIANNGSTRRLISNHSFGNVKILVIHLLEVMITILV